MKDKVIEDFIENFNEAKNIFLNGCCYWFAFILAERFRGEIYYNPVENHFACIINNGKPIFSPTYYFVDNVSGMRLYDINGEITDESKLKEYVFWECYRDPAFGDPIHANRIEEDCILKIKRK